MHKLIIEDDEGKAVVVPLIRDEITVGRQEGNTIRLTERNVSRRHARLVRREGIYFVEDLGSYTGTRVNGLAIGTPFALKDGDSVLIGDYKLGIKIEATGVPVAVSPVPGTVPVQATVPGPASAPPVPATAPVTAPAGNPPEATVAEPIEGQPTIPVRTLADRGLQGLVPGMPIPAPPARLVVITTPLAGSEFVLDHASLVIGRTPENDVVLNHKSISRHHAKIIREGERYVVVDLESANGVRVNGAEYERVELQTGDVVELGHVRLRFVGANDTSTFDFEGLHAGPLRKPLIIGGAAALAVAGIVIALAVGDKAPPESAKTPSKPTKVAAAPSEPVAPSPPSAPAGLAATPPTSPEAPATAAPPKPARPNVETTALLAQAKAAAQQEKWTEALDAAEKAASLAPGLAEAEELRKAIAVERQNAGQFQILQKAAHGKNYEAVLTAFSAIPVGSVYKDRAKPLQQAATTKVVAKHIAMAEKARSAGNCADARREAEAALELEAGNKAAQAVIDRCNEPERAPKPLATTPRAAPKPIAAPKPAPKVVAATAPAPRLTRTAAVTPPPTRAQPPLEQTAGDPDDLMQQAQDAWLRGQYAAAIDASRRALRMRPGMTRAYQIIAVCSCSLRDGDSAARAYDKLDDRIKQLVRQACLKSGITLN